ncbi:MAG: PadR family transcriptional regulator [Acidobacteriota bacterium]|jgi:DNA-binding PadR family transcriptional regulator
MQNALQQDPEVLLPLKPRVFMVLAILNDGPCHGYGILKQMKERSGGSMRMDAGLLYRTLARLTDKGVVRDAPEHVDPHDARRRYYELTDFGVQVLAAEARRQQELLGSLALADSGGKKR